MILFEGFIPFLNIIWHSISSSKSNHDRIEYRCVDASPYVERPFTKTVDYLLRSHSKDALVHFRVGLLFVGRHVVTDEFLHR